MSDRPTPEQMTSSPSDVIWVAKRQLLADLHFYGYVIVHPDDVREKIGDVLGLRENFFGEITDDVMEAIFGEADNE